MYTLSAWGPILVVAYVVVFIHQYHKSDPMHLLLVSYAGQVLSNSGLTFISIFLVCSPEH